MLGGSVPQHEEPEANMVSQSAAFLYLPPSCLLGVLLCFVSKSYSPEKVPHGFVVARISDTSKKACRGCCRDYL